MDAGHGEADAVPDMLSRSLIWLARTVGCALILSGLVAVGVASAQGSGGGAKSRIQAFQAENYGRLIITFEKDMPAFEVSASTGVLVISFEEPAAPDVTDAFEIFGGYVTAARRDPDGRAIRMALAQPVSVNTMEAGEKLFVDLLPAGWVGMPPALPQEVVAALARRAEEAEERRRQQELLEKFRNSDPVEVRITSLPTFTRFVFVFDEPPDARIHRGVDNAQVLFDRPARIDLTGLKSRLPPYVQNIASRLGDDGLEVSLIIDPESPIRGFREDNAFVVDVTAPGSPDVGAAYFGPPDDEGGEALVGEGDTAGYAAPSPAGMPEKSWAFDTEAEILVTDSDEPDDAVAAEVTVAASPEKADFGDIEPVRPEARRAASTVKLTLPFAEPTSAAAFELGGALWAVFETAQPIDTRLLRKDLSGYVSAVESWHSGKATVLRLTLAKPLLTNVAGESSKWFITLGDVTLEPGETLSLLRSLGEDGQPQAIVKFPSANAVHEVTDPTGRERLFVVTARPPTRSIPKPFNFVEFSTPSTIHGMVVKPIADDLVVTFDGQDVRISRERGLTMSEVNAAYTPGYTAGFDDRRPGYVRSFDDTSIDPGAVYQLLARHVRETALTEEANRTDGRLQMARALLGTDLGAEALAQLNLIERDDPAALRDPSVRALRGIGMVMMHRPDEAIREFDSFGLNQSSDVALWRGLAETYRGNWQAAGAAFKKGEAALSSYSAVRQKQFRIAAAEAAIESNDIAEAAVLMAELEETGDPNDPDQQITLLGSRLAAALGQKDDALRGFDKVIANGDQRQIAEAQLRHAETNFKTSGDAVSDEIIENLERLAISWRGDEIELGALRLLANLYIDRYDYYRAFEVMKSATVANSASPTTRALQDEMNLAFEELFLGGRAREIPAVDALALYYDFRELTPIGRKGDQIIRTLADRMVEVDLLQQAGDLLRHQVDNRLNGAERAQVAAKLAWVYLMNRKPADAIIVLSRTRQAVLPREVAYQRLILEARALGETGRLELALDLLSSAEGPEIDQVRAEVLWNGERWQDAGEAFESGLDTAWNSTAPLNAGQRTEVLRSAISYALADDALSLQRIRTKYLEKMAESPDAKAFDVVTLPVPENIGEFSELVARVAAVDTLDAFLEEYKNRYVLPSDGPEKVAANT